MSYSTWRRHVALLVCAGLVLAACSTKTDNGGSSTQSTKSAGPPQSGGTLNVGLDAETDGWNPTSSQWAGAAYYVGQTVFDPLVAFGEDNKSHPVLAKSVTPNADNTVWTIKLRPGIKFQDGEPLNAAAVKLQLDKDKASFLVGQAFHPMKSVDVVDNLTVRVNMSQPWVAFTSAITGQAGFIAAPKQLNATGAAATDHPIGTGAYTFKEWVRDDHLTVTKNPNYWRKGTSYPSQITFRVIPDDQTRLSSLQSGQLDLTYTGVASVILQARRDSSLQTREANSDPTTMIMFNTAVPPFNDLRLRQAVSYAIDQKQLIDTVGRGLGTQSIGPYLKDSPWYGPNPYPTKPDLTKAKNLVAAYKQSKGVSGDIKFTLGCTPTPTNTQAMELIKTQLGKVGINANVKYTEQATYINNALMGSYQANCWVQLGASDPDGDSIWWNLAKRQPGRAGGPQLHAPQGSKIDAALEEGRTNPDQAARKAAYDKVWKRFAADVPYAWLSHARISVMWSGKVHGVGEGTLPDGTKPLLFRGAIPTLIPLGGIWLGQ